ncbi:hypothetical protein GIB67_007784 [Kingdonia uniflora]|uniref:26S proteasome non-ATPase regulatory subunit RPN1 C-terminal domain-containing protein n=1 Tax=Kingdonia uniflora TaxID=39325 RepID=A0A7J7N1X8_9MAGN|nr:hypothetical protein GIB67_007784 [Kingdonia uniflora]
MKYTGGLSETIKRELKLFTVANIEDATVKAISIEGNADQRVKRADMYVNAFVNAGFGQSMHHGKWLFNEEEYGLGTSAIASLGMILLWDADVGSSEFFKYFGADYDDESDASVYDNSTKAGALLGLGICNCNINDETASDLSLYVDIEDPTISIGAIMGLGLAYAGSKSTLIGDLLKNVLTDPKRAIEVQIFSALSIGLVYVGAPNDATIFSMLDIIKGKAFSEIKKVPIIRLLPLAVGLFYLGKQDDQAVAHISNSVIIEFQTYFRMTLLSGTGNVDKSVAVIGIAMIAMADEEGIQMAIRSLEHLNQRGEQNIRQAVPLALGLVCISNPQVDVTNTLLKLSRDEVPQVAMAAIISTGLIGAGTNNGRIASHLLRLMTYHRNNTNLVYCVRIAQGLLHMGKGLLTLNPYHSNRFLLSPKGHFFKIKSLTYGPHGSAHIYSLFILLSRTALAGILIWLHASLEAPYYLLGDFQFVLYFIVLAMQPRMLITVDENLNPLPVSVRVGNAIDVTAMPGQQSTISGSTTHMTSILLAAGQRAELASEEYISVTPVLEGCVILKRREADKLVALKESTK